MDKTRKNLIKIIIVLLIILVGIGTYSFISYCRGDSNIYINIGDDSHTIVLDGTPEEVGKAIQNDYLGEGGEVYYSHEEDDCWYYTSNTDYEYTYCHGNGTFIISYNVGDDEDH